MNDIIAELQGKINQKNEPQNHELIPLEGKNCQIHNYYNGTTKIKNPI